MNRRHLVQLVAVGALVVPLAFAGSAGATGGPSIPDQVPSTTRTPVAAQAARASGIIVQTTDGTVSTGLRARAEDLADRAVVRATKALGDLRVLRLDEPLPLEEAQQVAAALERRSDVVSAEPDVIFTTQANPPVPRNDELFSQQYGVWDRRATFPGYGISLPAGGYSVRAPSLWRATVGKSTVRVAVIDTGITTHPDLAGQTVAGYDFLTSEKPGPPEEDDNRDGTPGRDSDPSDPGDWTPNATYCGPDTSVEDSSWHGTHVAGIIAAKANNSIGIAGIASGVKVQPIRALGACGGSTSDIAPAIEWAAGVAVPGLPANPTPAKVINLSLGGQSPCGTTFQTAINHARAKGAVVVAAAGNQSDKDTIAPIDAPANCAGVVAVVATDEIGQAALYSSLGTSGRPANIAAPGGDFSAVEKLADKETGSGIVSTLNSGLTVPADPSYVEYQGTSMATPAVAAGAGLLSSLGYNRAEIEAALKKAVQPFPQYVDAIDGPFEVFNCYAVGCGAGILDLSTVPVPLAKPTITGTMKRGKKISVSNIKWIGRPSYAFQWYRNGKRISKATKSKYTLTKADRRKHITVRVYGKKTGFKTFSTLSPSRRVSKK